MGAPPHELFENFRFPGYNLEWLQRSLVESGFVIRRINAHPKAGCLNDRESFGVKREFRRLLNDTEESWTIVCENGYEALIYCWHEDGVLVACVDELNSDDEAMEILDALRRLSKHDGSDK